MWLVKKIYGDYSHVMLAFDGLVYDMTYGGVQVSVPSPEELSTIDIVNLVITDEEEVEFKNILINLLQNSKKFHPFRYNCVHFVCEVLGGLELEAYTPIALYKRLLLDKVG